MNRVRLGFLSLGGRPASGTERDYVRWHQLDHMPEQFGIPGVIHGCRWVATPRCLAARAAAAPDLEPVRHAQLYLMGDPVEQTLDEFAALGRTLAGAGRYPVALGSHLLGGFELIGAWAAPRVQVSADVIPWRPHLGMYLLVEEVAGEPSPALEGLDVEGVAGAWAFAASPATARPHWTHRNHRVTVCWLDGDPIDAAASLAPVLDDRWRAGAPLRPALALPFESLVSWEWDRVSSAAAET